MANAPGSHQPSLTAARPLERLPTPRVGTAHSPLSVHDSSRNASRATAAELLQRRQHDAQQAAAIASIGIPAVSPARAEAHKPNLVAATTIDQSVSLPTGLLASGGVVRATLATAPQPIDRSLPFKTGGDHGTTQHRNPAAEVEATHPDETKYAHQPSASPSEALVDQVNAEHDCCDTLATFMTLALANPPDSHSGEACFSNGLRGTMLLLIVVVWTLQFALTSKLYDNAWISDGGQILLDIGLGYMEMDYQVRNTTCPEDHPAENSSIALVPCSGLRRCANSSAETAPAASCRGDMMNAFDEELRWRKAHECPGCNDATQNFDRDPRFSSDVSAMYEPRPVGIGLCFTDEGLQNGYFNLGLGMMIIIAMLLREILEAVGGIYTVTVLDMRGQQPHLLDGSSTRRPEPARPPPEKARSAGGATNAATSSGDDEDDEADDDATMRRVVRIIVCYFSVAMLAEATSLPPWLFDDEKLGSAWRVPAVLAFLLVLIVGVPYVLSRANWAKGGCGWYGWCGSAMALVRSMQDKGRAKFNRRLNKGQHAAGGGYTAPRNLLANVFVVAIVGFHLFIGIRMLFASFRHMVNAPNSIWAVVETSISGFLVLSIDDAVLYCFLQHPAVRSALSPLASRDLEKHQHKKGIGAELLCRGRPTGCQLWQPTAHMRQSGELCPYKYAVEGMSVWFLCWFLGGRLARFTELACADALANHGNLVRGAQIISRWGPCGLVCMALAVDVRALNLWRERRQWKQQRDDADNVWAAKP